MELLFVVLGGMIIGLVTRYLIPLRDYYGVALTISVGGTSAAIAWLVFTLASWPWDGGWIWVVSFVFSAIVSIVVAIVTGKARLSSESRFLASHHAS